jgi:hypothetical protein
VIYVFDMVDFPAVLLALSEFNHPYSFKTEPIPGQDERLPMRGLSGVSDASASE